MTASELAESISVDAFLGGRVEALQPRRGHHRSGLEAVLLAAALDETTAGAVIDLGAGAGVAGLCAAFRCPEADVTLVERDPALLDLAAAALSRPANRTLQDRVHLATLDVAAAEPERLAAGLARETAVAILTNPPFHAPETVRPSPAAARAAAHVRPAGLEPWFRFAAWALASGGTVVAVVPATALKDALDGLEGRFGAVAVLPIHPRPETGAHRVLLRGAKDSRAPLALLPGLVLHPPSGSRFTEPVEALLRGKAGLGDIHPPWRVSGGD